MTPLMSSGIELMLIGMGTVFTFLTLLVFATKLMSHIVLRFVPNVQPIHDSAVDQATDVDSEVVAAITVALRQHRSEQRDVD